MGDQPQSLDQEITELEASLQQQLPPATRRLVERRLAALRGQQSTLINIGDRGQAGDISMGDAAGGDLIKGNVSLSGDVPTHAPVVGVNFGQIIYGHTPEEDERRRLVRYLSRLANKFARLPLRGLAEHLDHGEGVSLDQVYVQLASESSTIELVQGTLSQLHAYLDPTQGNRLRPECSPDYVLPGQAVVWVEQFGRFSRNHSDWIDVQEAEEFARLGPDRLLRLSRSMLLSEIVWRHQHLVLLGAPGSGKSTFVRHLASSLARRGLDQFDHATTLLGWEDARRLLPIILSLRALASRIAREGSTEVAVLAALSDELRAYGVGQVDDLLNATLENGTAILLLDGLDEVPLSPSPNISAGRRETLLAIRDFVAMHPAVRSVVTCRTRAFDHKLRAALGWPVEEIAAFTPGQMRHFVLAWYDELAAKQQLPGEQVSGSSELLIQAVLASPKLTEMAQSPLLLTMMALVVLNRGELPRDRPILYERILNLLLGQWDQVRAGEGLAEAIGLPDWGSERITPLLDRLSYEAHLGGSSLDGRGSLERGALYKALIDFFREAQVPSPGDAALRWLDYVEQRSGLLMADGPESYTFAHLTLQEHCAGRALVIHRDAVARVMQHRADDRWREPILLGLGVVQQTNPFLIEAVLRRLLSRNEAERAKEPDRWHRDLIFAAEIGKDRDWAYLRQRGMDAAGIQADLRAGLAELLGDRSQPLPVVDRLYAGSLLGDLGDPRFPVIVDEWQRELSRRGEQFGSPAGYWCYVPPGRYLIGGWDTTGEGAEVELPPFWIARLPMTVAQYTPFVAAGYGPKAERWWTKAGWQWKPAERSTGPWSWGRPSYNGRNQPVIGVSWYEAMAFCTWLSEQLGDAIPSGHVIRLPSEAEWEVAAAYDSYGRRRAYPWGERSPDLERALYEESKLGKPAPVGSYPSGAAACGALDMAGNVLELTTSSYAGYPARSQIISRDFLTSSEDIPVRGGAWAHGQSLLRCGARELVRPGGRVNNYHSFRVVLVPRSS